MCYISFSLGQYSLGLGLLNEGLFTFQEANYPEKEHLVDVHQNELFYFPFIARKLWKVEGLVFLAPRRAPRLCLVLWLSEKRLEIQDQIFLVNNQDRKDGEQKISQVFLLPLFLYFQFHTPPKKSFLFQRLMIVLLLFSSMCPFQ